MANDYVLLDEAARVSGLSAGSIQRLLQRGEIEGYKAVVRSRRRWLVSVRSLRQYTDPETGFLLTKPGPRIYLKRRDQDRGDP